MRLVRNLAFLFFLAVVVSANPTTLRAEMACPEGCDCTYGGGYHVWCGLLENCGGQGFCGAAADECSRYCGTFTDFDCVGGSQCTADCNCMLFD